VEEPPHSREGIGKRKKGEEEKSKKGGGGTTALQGRQRKNRKSKEEKEKSKKGGGGTTRTPGQTPDKEGRRSTARISRTRLVPPMSVALDGLT
jgi:hypothetical protein